MNDYYGWSTKETWEYWTILTNMEPVYNAVRDLKKSSTDADDLARRLSEIACGQNEINFKEIADAIWEGQL